MQQHAWAFLLLANKKRCQHLPSGGMTDRRIDWEMRKESKRKVGTSASEGGI